MRCRDHDLGAEVSGKDGKDGTTLQGLKSEDYFVVQIINRQWMDLFLMDFGWIFSFLIDFPIPAKGMNDGYISVEVLAVLGGLQHFHFGLLGIDVVLCKDGGSLFRSCLGG